MICKRCNQKMIFVESMKEKISYWNCVFCNEVVIAGKDSKVNPPLTKFEKTESGVILVNK